MTIPMPGPTPEGAKPHQPWSGPGCTVCGTQETVSLSVQGRRCAADPPTFDPVRAVELMRAGFPDTAAALPAHRVGRCAVNIGSLFSGYGGLEEGVRSVLGGTVAWHSEIDPGACKILAHRYPDVPNLGDITAVDWSAVEPVDVLTGGSPCQDVSAAGKRLGMRAGTRSGLWASMCDAIDIIRPGLVVWENVRGVLSAGADSAVEPCSICVGDERDSHLRALGRVVGDLAELGYVGRWTGLRAADVGAPHGRFRVFVVAWPADASSDQGRLSDGDGGPADPDAAELRRRPSRGDDGVRAARLVTGPVADASGIGRSEPAGAGEDRRAGAAFPWREAVGAPAAHPSGDGRHEGRPEPARLGGGPDAALGGDAAADTDKGRQRADHDLLRRGQPDTDQGAPADAHGAGLGRLEELHAVPQAGHGARGRDDTDGLAVAAGGVDWGPYGPAVARWERCLGRPAPSPTERGRNGQPRLSPAFVEWLMGLPAGWVTDVPGLGRNEQLRCLGNGVVPAQAAAALRILLTEASAAA